MRMDASQNGYKFVVDYGLLFTYFLLLKQQYTTHFILILWIKIVRTFSYIVFSSTKQTIVNGYKTYFVFILKCQTQINTLHTLVQNGCFKINIRVFVKRVFAKIIKVLFYKKFISPIVRIEDCDIRSFGLSVDRIIVDSLYLLQEESSWKE